MKINTLSSVRELRNIVVLVRADFNVPLKNKKVRDDFKILQIIPTLEFLCRGGARVVLVSHLGRPNGIDKNLSLQPLAKILEKKLHVKIRFLPIEKRNKYWEEAKSEIKKLLPGRLLLLENVRFFKGEEINDKSFTKSLAQLADVFVLDGFAVAHRGAASVSGVAKLLPTYAGLLLEREMNGLNRVIKSPKKPLVVVLGGAKMETKIPVLKSLLPKASNILVGGGIFNTYLWAKGYAVGGSLIDKEYKKEALRYLDNPKIVLPVDVIAGDVKGKKTRLVKIDKDFALNNDEAIYDAGPATMRLYSEYIKKANTLVWNGALGYFEQHPYEFGTRGMAYLFARRSKGKAFGVAGGGETVEILRDMDLLHEIDLVSTGGGAMLEFLSGKKLPGVQAVLKK